VLIWTELCATVVRKTAQKTLTVFDLVLQKIVIAQLLSIGEDVAYASYVCHKMHFSISDTIMQTVKCPRNYVMAAL